MQKSKKLWWVGIVLLGLSIAVWWGKRTPPTRYQTVVVEQQDLIRSVLASGKLDALTKVEVGTQISGQLQQLAVKLGDKVEKGQLLAVIDPSKAQNRVAVERAKLQALRAARAESRVALALAHLKQQRLVDLVRVQAKPRVELEEANANLALQRSKKRYATAQIEQQRLELQRAESDLAQTQIIAPITGRVINIQIKEGQTVVSAQAASTILTLADLRQMTVRIHVSEADVIHLQTGLAAEFTLLGDPQRRFGGTIREIEWLPVRISDALFYPVLFDVDNDEALLRIDMTTQVSIILERRKETLVIPFTAVGPLLADGRYQVQILVAGKPQLRQVLLGVRNEVMVQVLDGLRLGEAVVVKTLDANAA